MAKPALLPEWAINIVVDGTSGQNNRTVPTQQERDDGFIPLNVKPKRQATNWLFNTIFKWIEYFDENVDQDVRIAATPTFNAIITTADLTVGGDIVGPINVTGAAGNTFEGPINITSAATSALTGGILINGKATLAAAINSYAGSDSGITGAQLDVLSNSPGSFADALHTHNIFPFPVEMEQGLIITSGEFQTFGNLRVDGTFTLQGDLTGITGAELETLSDGSDADTLHRHSDFLNMFRTGYQFQIERFNAAPTTVIYETTNGVGNTAEVTHNEVVATGQTVIKQVSRFNFVKRSWMNDLNIIYQARVQDRTSISNRFDILVFDGGALIGIDSKLGTSFSVDGVYEAVLATIDISSVANGIILEAVFSMNCIGATSLDQNNACREITLQPIA